MINLHTVFYAIKKEKNEFTEAIRKYDVAQACLTT